ncbi:rhomboid family intramembrane serine protease [Hydrogenophaga sp. RWCD_12]|uniref:rhomboid family intramembrane serine protease n=1 Tax=Hydrogenophaga sp. RWCD_12 TaxID=3391190 RepID=UPI0039852656
MASETQSGAEAFHASWRSGSLNLGLLSIGMAALMGAAAMSMGTKALLLGGMAAFFGFVGAVLLRQLVGPAPLLVVGPAGVTARLFNGHTIPWTEISDVQYGSVQGQHILTFVLRPGSPWLARTRPMLGFGLKRNLSLGALRTADRERAIGAAMQGFRRHAGPQAQAAGRALMDDAVAEEAFEEQLQAVTPSLWALYAVMALNGAVWLATVMGGLSPMKPLSADLFAWGANSATAVVRDGELWRLLTATVLHAGVLHLALNMWALWDAGRQVGRWYGNGQFLLIYGVSALAGSALSLHFSSQQAVSVGASGAVFGVLGALVTGVYQHRHRVPKGVFSRLMTSQAVFVVIMLGQGFAREGIDNAAHVGGLLAGAVMAWLLVERVETQASAAHRRQRRLLATGVAAMAVAALVWTARPGVDHRELFRTQAALRTVLPAMRAAEQALHEDAKGQKEGRLTGDQFIVALEQRHIPAYRAVGQTLQGLRPEPPIPPLDNLRERQGAVLEMMELEVGRARGTVDPQHVRERVAALNRRLNELNRAQGAAP